MSHRSQRTTPRHPKSAPRPIAPRPTEFPGAPSTAFTALPTPSRTAKTYIPLPASLIDRINAITTLSRRVESIVHGLNYGLFTTAAEHHDAQARLQQLRTAYSSLRPDIDRELTALGHLPSTGTSYTPLQRYPTPTTKLPPTFPKLNTTAHLNPSHKHKHGPTSPKYTVDKALKRKADSQGGAASLHKGTQPLAKKQRLDGGVESDFVETDCESVGEGSREVAEAWPPAAITNLGMEKPLGKAERRKMNGWSWEKAMKRGGYKKKGEAECMSSPLGKGKHALV